MSGKSQRKTGGKNNARYDDHQTQNTRCDTGLEGKGGLVSKNFWALVSNLALQAGRMKMRKVTSKDGWRVAEFMAAYYPEAVAQIPLGNRGKFQIDENYVAAWAEKAVNHPNCIAFIDEDNGIILGELAETNIGPNKIARGGIWYVRPEARSGLLAWRLLEAFDKEANERGALCGRMEVDNPVHLGTIERMYKKIGFRPFSKIYVKEY